MDYSAANTALWNILIQFGILAAAIIIANVLRRKIPFFHKSLLPTAVLAGFLLLILRSVGVLKLDGAMLEMITYHGIVFNVGGCIQDYVLTYFGSSIHKCLVEHYRAFTYLCVF